jgi:hypothetical protein
VTRQSMIVNALTALVVVVGALASQLPGLSFFSEYAPPSFGMLALVTSGLTLGVFALVFVTTSNASHLVRRGAIGVVAAIVLALIYTALLDWVTVMPPDGTGSTQRYQIGFGLSHFSLTPAGLADLTANPGLTAQDLLLRAGGFRQDGPHLVWHSWTVFTAWLVLSLVFLAAYAAWSFGLACLAKWLLPKTSGKSPRGPDPV